MMVREAQPADVPQIVGLVHGLAAYENAAASCTLTSEQLQKQLFGPAPAVFALVAEADSQVVGTCLWFLNFSTWDGVHGIHIEDLFVLPDYRGRGLGRDFFAVLAGVCRERGYSRIQWQVLDWNTPSIDFYAGLGAVRLDGWHAQRLSGAPLAALAERGLRLPYAQRHDQGGSHD